MALRAVDASSKAARVDALLCSLRSSAADTPAPADAGMPSAEDPAPGMPARLRLVDPREVGRRGLGSDTGRACFLHAIMHIEFNAINLALDIAWRFPGMPRRFYQDWLEVAADEARHFAMLESRLVDLGHAYGDFPVHDGLWDIARRTAHDVAIRLAMVPCVMEARGLDVTPAMIQRLRGVGDHASAGILQRILEEEENHVAIGLTWYRRICAERGLDPADYFFNLMEKYLPGRIRGRLNLGRRRSAGFDEQWLARLTDYAARGESGKSAP
jgi:uncharacterized ferritin-like protein (DUF455 family)